MKYSYACEKYKRKDNEFERARSRLSCVFIFMLIDFSYNEFREEQRSN